MDDVSIFYIIVITVCINSADKMAAVLCLYFDKMWKKEQISHIYIYNVSLACVEEYHVCFGFTFFKY